MLPTDIIELTEIKAMLSRGEKDRALPGLYRLAAAYPEDQEIKELLRQALAVNPPPPPPPQPFPPQPPVYYVQQPSPPQQQQGQDSRAAAAVYDVLIVFLALGLGAVAIYILIQIFK